MCITIFILYLFLNLTFSFQIRERCRELVFTDTQNREIMKRLLDDLNKGLGKKTHPSSIVKCFVTYVQDLPNGTG